MEEVNRPGLSHALLSTRCWQFSAGGRCTSANLWFRVLGVSASVTGLRWYWRWGGRQGLCTTSSPWCPSVPRFPLSPSLWPSPRWHRWGGPLGAVLCSPGRSLSAEGRWARPAVAAGPERSGPALRSAGMPASYPPPPPPIRCSRHSSSTAWRRLRTHPLDADSIWAGSALARVYCPRGPHHRLPLAAAAPRAPSPRPAVPRSPARLRDFRADSPRQARHGSIPPGASFLLPGPRPFPTLNHYCSPASLLVLFLSPPQVAGLRGLPPSLPRGLGSSALRLPRAACGCPGPGARVGRNRPAWARCGCPPLRHTFQRLLQGSGVYK